MLHGLLGALSIFFGVHSSLLRPSLSLANQMNLSLCQGRERGKKTGHDGETDRQRSWDVGVCAGKNFLPSVPSPPHPLLHHPHPYYHLPVHPDGLRTLLTRARTHTHTQPRKHTLCKHLHSNWGRERVRNIPMMCRILTLSISLSLSLFLSFSSSEVFLYFACPCPSTSMSEWHIPKKAQENLEKSNVEWERTFC